MINYLETLNPIIREYYSILSCEFPEFLIDYINTPRMQKLDKISVSCGMPYSKMFKVDFWYSTLEHSIAVALIIWHFTKDKKQTLAGLFHDISTPVFKHCIDYMNEDAERQESTEDLTKAMILESDEIMELLMRDNIKVEEVSNYHLYSIADNDIPRLSADRLEYTIINGLGQVKKMWDLEEVKEIYDDIIIVENEDKALEMCFKDLKIADKFTKVMSELSVIYTEDKRRFGMQFLGDIMKRMSSVGLISVSDLYELSEKDVIEMIKSCNKFNISTCFNLWQNSLDVKVSDKEIKDKYCVNVGSKKRYIDSLVKTNNTVERISKISKQAKKYIDSCINYDFDRYIYMDFNFKDE